MVVETVFMFKVYRLYIIICCFFLLLLLCIFYCLHFLLTYTLPLHHLGIYGHLYKYFHFMKLIKCSLSQYYPDPSIARSCSKKYVVIKSLKSFSISTGFTRTTKLYDKNVFLNVIKYTIYHRFREF